MSCTSTEFIISICINTADSSTVFFGRGAHLFPFQFKSLHCHTVIIGLLLIWCQYYMEIFEQLTHATLAVDRRFSLLEFTINFTMFNACTTLYGITHSILLANEHRCTQTVGSFRCTSFTEQRIATKTFHKHYGGG